MSRFYVGQRVRIAITINFHAMKGMEATITGMSIESDDWQVDIDGVGQFAPDGHLWSAYSWQLEPITDSYDVVSWNDCVWQPEHLRAAA